VASGHSAVPVLAKFVELGLSPLALLKLLVHAHHVVRLGDGEALGVLDLAL
jgi:hypothetical protein